VAEKKKFVSGFFSTVMAFLPFFIISIILTFDNLKIDHLLYPEIQINSNPYNLHQ